MARLVVIQGAPAVGKTTLTRKLATELQLGFIAKDDFKELLYDKLGLPLDRNRSRVYGTAVMRAMFDISRTLLEGNVDHILESAFHPSLANTDFQKLLNGIEDLRVVQLFCYTTPEIQAERYTERLQTGTRHPGHPHEPKDASAFVGYNARYTKLALVPCLEVDMSVFGDAELAVLVENVEKILEGKHEKTN